MKKSITLKMADLLGLQLELKGSEQNKIIGLLNQKLNIVLKYRLSILDSSLQPIVEKVDSLKRELITKFGTTNENGDIYINMYLNVNAEGNPLDGETKQINPKFVEFNNEFNKLLMEDVEFEYVPINLNDLIDIETTDNYTILFKLISDNTIEQL